MSLRTLTLLAACILGGGEAQAQAAGDPPLQESGAGRSVLVVADEPGEFVARVRAELVGLGYRVQVVAKPPPSVDEDTAAIVVSSDDRVDVWLVAPNTRYRELHASVPRLQSGSDSVRVAEQLRGLFQHLPALPSPPAPRAAESEIVSADPAPGQPSPAPKPPLVADRRPQARPRAAEQRLFVADAGIAALSQPGGPGLALALGAHVRATSWLRLGLMSALPLVASTLEAEQGKASVRATLIGAEAELELPPALLVPLSVRAGAAAAWVFTSGDAEGSFEDQDDSLWTALPFVGLVLSPALSARTELRASVLVGASVPRAEVRFAGERVADFGRPLVMTSLGLAFEI